MKHCDSKVTSATRAPLSRILIISCQVNNVMSLLKLLFMCSFFCALGKVGVTETL